MSKKTTDEKLKDFSDLLDSLDKTEDKLAPGSFNNDKWNPGDIWLSTFGKTEEPLKPCRIFNDLKKCVLDFSGEGNLPTTSLLGASLKKPAAKAKIVEYNKWTDPKRRAHNNIILLVKNDMGRQKRVN